MNTRNRLAGIALTLALFAIPASASAHAAPVHSEPQSAATVQSVPPGINIEFSERVDGSASSIRVTGPSGAAVSTEHARVSLDDARELSVPIRPDGDGTYLVSWSVVSADDGHFTKGAYPFAVGAGVTVDTSGAADTEMVQISTTPEAMSIAVELMGNGFLLAIILLFMFAFRPLRSHTAFIEHTKQITRGYLFVLFAGALLVFSGALAQIIIKSQSLAGLQAIDFRSAVALYVHTVAGAATVYRMLAVVAVCTVAAIGIKRIIASRTVTSFEVVMLLAMSAFEYFRAVISHATANPFHPHLSVAVNFVHLIEKDFWAGAAGIALCMACSRRLWPLFSAAVPRIFLLLAVDLISVSVTACYIVWLHLKSFQNLFSTQWGVVFMQLLIVAVCLVTVRLYHVFAYRYRPQLFLRYLIVSLAAEFAFAMLVVYCSSVVIITSPPLAMPDQQFRTVDQGVAITLEQDAYEDGMLLISAQGTGVFTPAVAIEGTDGSPEISVDLSRRFNDGYTFPSAVLSGAGPFNVSITVPQAHGYDAHAQFAVPKDFIAARSLEEYRTFDRFTVCVILIAIAALLFALIVYRFSTLPVSMRGSSPRRVFPEFAGLIMFLLFSFFGATLVTAYGGSSLSNPYKSECESDGNMWHLMLPTVAGTPVSQTPREGCMWGMGRFPYQFPDRRAYDYLSTLGTSTVSFTNTPEHLTEGVPATLTFALKNSDGTPATLLVDMEKYIHIVIISKDESVFAHIHPDDVRPLTAESIAASTFSAVYTFPKAGTYLIAVDYAHGTQLESQHFEVQVLGSTAQTDTPHTFASPGVYDGYGVSMDASGVTAGSVATLRFNVTQNGAPVTDMSPYLSAVSHISVVKNDLSTFIHTHGEVHAPGTPLPVITVKNGQVIHSMASMTSPTTFGPNFEAHVIFPTAGRYTVWAQFKRGDLVVPASFTVDVE